jgi:hypothetical protein
MFIALLIRGTSSDLLIESLVFLPVLDSCSSSLCCFWKLLEISFKMLMNQLIEIGLLAGREICPKIRLWQDYKTLQCAVILLITVHPEYR